MRCTRVEKFLPLHVAGDLKNRHAAHVAHHLATCERCRSVAAEYDASRNLMREAATLPPDFDAAFYEELRRSVLAEIKRDWPRIVPPASARFASLFNARFAYAASLGLIVAAVAALALHSYVGRKSEDAAQQNSFANANLERVEMPTATATPESTQAKGDEREILSPVNKTAREDVRREAQAAKSSSPKRRAQDRNAQNEMQPPSVELVKRAPSHVNRNQRARISVAALETAGAGEIAINSGESGTAPEVSRIEIQTSDPNIRIIWLSPKPDDAVAQPLK